MTKIELQAFLDKVFPKNNMTILEILEDGVLMRYNVNDKHLRPGGTIAGPVMMGFADAAMYMAVLSKIGLIALAVTTNFNINFLKKPAPENLLAKASIIKLGKRLAVGEISIYSETNNDLVSHATCTYSIPKKDHS